MNDAIVHFVIGSSPIITIFPYFMLYNAHNRLPEDDKDECKISFSTLCLGLPFVYGLLFAMLYNCCSFIPRKTKNTYTRFIVCGALSSMMVSILLHYIFHIHEDWFHVENPSMVHVGTLVFYLVLYYTIGQWVRAQILYGPTPSSPSSPPSLSVLPSAPPSAVGKYNSPSVNPVSAKFDAIAAKASK